MHKFRSDFLILLLATLSLLVGSCERKPTEPVEPREYVFWMAEYINPVNGPYRYYRYFPLQDRFDTLTSPYRTSYEYGPTMSADGSKLYLVDDGITAVSTDDMRFLDRFPGYGQVSVSTDGQYIAICSQEGVQIRDAKDHSLYFEDSTRLYEGHFTRDCRSYFALYYSFDPYDTAEFHVVQFDLPGRSVYRRIRLPHGLPLAVFPIENGKRLLLSLKYHTFDYAFAVYDLALDSFLLWHYLTPGAIQIAVSRDEHYAIVTNPGTLLLGPPPPSSFLIFDLRSNQLLEEVDTRVVRPDSIYHNGKMPTKHVAITPDSKRALITGIDDGEFLIYNLETMRIEKYYDYSFTNGIITTWFNYVTCQAKP